MVHNQSKRQKWLKIARPAILALVLVTVLTYVSYSWIKREWTPNIKQEGIKILAGDSLVFIFDDGYGNVTEIPSEGKTVNELLDLEEFALKSVSNVSGKSTDFFALDYTTQGQYSAVLKHLENLNQENEDVAYRELGKAYGYIELKFTVQVPETSSSDERKGIFIHDDSEIALNQDTDSGALYNPLNALRMSITVHDYDPENSTDRDLTLLFAATELRAGKNHQAITNKSENGQYVADRQYLYIKNDNNEYVKNIDVIKEGELLHPLSDYMFNEGTGKPLFTLAGGESKQMTVRIWLEGEDDDCRNDISGQAIDLVVKFWAKTVSAAASSELS